jgi:hypothetical protein
MEAIWIVLIVLVGGVLAWGLMQNKRRNRANDPVTSAATKALYEDPKHYDNRRSEFTDQVEPSDKP